MKWIVATNVADGEKIYVNPTMDCETCEFLKEYKREVTE